MSHSESEIKKWSEMKEKYKSGIRQLGTIDKKYKSGKITKKQHYTQSKKVVDKILKKL